MKDFHAKREEFLKKLGKLAAGSDFPVAEIKLHQLPKPGITLPGTIEPETVRKIMKIYNEVFK